MFKDIAAMNQNPNTSNKHTPQALDYEELITFEDIFNTTKIRDAEKSIAGLIRGNI
jgi:hypothetical protein